MKISILRGSAKPEYSLLLPEDKKVTDLNPEIQTAIQKLGELKIIQTKELDASIPSEKEAIEKIKAQGAHLWKITVQFTEIH